MGEGKSRKKVAETRGKLDQRRQEARELPDRSGSSSRRCWRSPGRPDDHPGRPGLSHEATRVGRLAVSRAFVSNLFPKRPSWWRTALP